MKLPVLILSDLHLAHKASQISQVKELRPLFKNIGTVIFNGDTTEELAEPWRDKSAQLFSELKALLKDEGCDTIFLRGNHDPEVPGEPFTTLANGKILITHGDCLPRASSPWKHEIIAKPELVDTLWDSHPQAESDVSERFKVAREIARKLPSTHYPCEKRFINRVIDAAFPPKRAIEILKAWLTQARLGAKFCDQYFPEAEFLIIGHFHWSCSREVSGKTVINTGAFVSPNTAGWVIWDGQYLERGAVCKANGFFKRDKPLEAWQVT